MPSTEDRERLGVWSVLLDPDLNIDRRKCHRVVPFQVLSVGFPRTGTASIQEALETLGLPTYHFASILANRSDADLWSAAIDAKFFDRGTPFGKAQWDQLLGHVSAITDAPSILFWDDLLRMYPDAKIILVDRDLDAWQKSFDVLANGLLSFFPRVLTVLDPWSSGRVFGLSRKYMKVMVGSDSLEEAKSGAKEHYRRHYEAVRHAVPKDKLLEYRLGSGWEPLCDFLGKPVPDVPFPHRNETKCLEAAFAVDISKTLRRIALRSTFAVAAVAASIQLVRMLRSRA